MLSSVKQLLPAHKVDFSEYDSRQWFKSHTVVSVCYWLILWQLPNYSDAVQEVMADMKDFRSVWWIF